MNQPASPYTSPQSNALLPEQTDVMSVKDWLITLLILAIPLVNLVMLLVWAFGGNTNPNKANFCKAYLVLLAAFMVLYILLIVVVGVGFSAAGAYAQ